MSLFKKPVKCPECRTKMSKIANKLICYKCGYVIRKKPGEEFEDN